VNVEAIRRPRTRALPGASRSLERVWDAGAARPGAGGSWMVMGALCFLFEGEEESARRLRRSGEARVESVLGGDAEVMAQGGALVVVVKQAALLQ
jgi:hypothetical protein